MAFAGCGGNSNDCSSAGINFTKWLNDKLRQLNTDESVFGSYITGILEDDETIEEKKDALEGILGEIIDKNIQDLIEEIFNKWNECHPKNEDDSKPKLKVDVDVQLAKMLESQKLQTTVQRQYTAEELRIREQILAQYSQTEVSEEEDADEPDEKASSAGLQKNTNVHDVIQLQKERREQAREDSKKKKEKDKEDREKQKQLREEKKEKRKTVKGERRR